MGNSKNFSSNASVSPSELIIASLIVAIWLAAFAFGYWEGRDFGSLLFRQSAGA